MNKMNSLSDLKPHACHMCDRSFTKQFNLRRHVENMHQESTMNDHDKVHDGRSHTKYHRPTIKKPRIEDSEEERELYQLSSLTYSPSYEPLHVLTLYNK